MNRRLNNSLIRKTAFLALVCLLLVNAQSIYGQTSKNKDDKIEIHNLSDTIVPTLVNKVEAYTYKIDRNNFFIKSNYNLEPIQDLLPPIEIKLAKFKKRFEASGEKMNLTSLNSSSILLDEVSDELTSYKNILTDYYENLTKSNLEVKKIVSDPDLQVIVPDSTLNEQVQDLLEEGTTLYNTQRRLLAKVNLLRSRISVSLLQSKDISSDMNYLSIAKKMNLWTQEQKPLLKDKAGNYEATFIPSISNALNRSAKIILISLNNRIQIITISFLLFILLVCWCYYNLKKIKNTINATQILSSVYFIRRSNIIAGLMAFFTYVPLFLGNPTIHVLHVCSLLRIACLSYLLLPYLTKYAKIVWTLLFIIWIYYAIDSLLIDQSFGERWGLVLINILLSLICFSLIIGKQEIFEKIKKSPATKAILIFTLTFTLLSLLLNFTGRVSLSKIIGLAAIQGLMLGISLKILSAIISEAIYLQTEGNDSGRLSEILNFQHIQKSLIRYLWFFTCLIWMVGLLRDLLLLDWIDKMFFSFLSKPRAIGNYSFSIGNLVVFIFIIWISSLISRFIKFFFDTEKVISSGKRSSLNSMILLFRLGIWIMGFLIAVAVANIPLDKLSIMLGALGVGIGFGLQNIVNNLVSGIILAFERPIQVGDQIEISGKSGTVKEIGVRSSKLRNSEGADIIVPNGDLLSQQLINWTMQDRNKRVEFTLNVPYDTDLDVAKSILMEQIKNEKGILDIPIPSILIRDFGDYGINLITQFWVEDLNSAGSMRTTIMMKAKKIFAEQGIKLQIRPINS